MDGGWYVRRLRQMSPGEVAWRLRDQAVRWLWRRRQVRATDGLGPLPRAHPRFPVVLPPHIASSVPEEPRRALLATADGILDGRWETLGTARADVVAPDWFLDPVTGRRAPRAAYALTIDHRSEREVGNVKQVWELSRHHHLTLLAAAWCVSHEERYAVLVDRQLRSWWRENPFLSGIHWTSGIELGIRLIAWSWIRRLLDDWPGAEELFEGNPEAARQLHGHQQYLASFRSVGSSANNHVIAEAAGQFVASCAFPWFAESRSWARTARSVLERELQRNTFPSGLNRELASDYHRFVTELGLIAAAEGEAAGHPVSDATWGCLCRMVDAAAALVDERLAGPRQGDGDDGRALVLDAVEGTSWSSLLALGAALVGARPWWPATVRGDARSTLLTGLVGRRREIHDRPGRRPFHFADAGLTLLRTSVADLPEIWVRCDGGPHGFLSIAAHAHADALSIEVRHGGVEVLADPGTYCYHGEPAWRSYFRSTLGHNTLELDERDQSSSGGPFLWSRHAHGHVLHLTEEDDARTLSWTAEHDGYRRLDPPAVHRRTVRLDRCERRVTVVDRVRSGGRHRCRLAFHLGPAVHADLSGAVAHLEWPVAGRGSATLRLPERLCWSAHRGETDPIAGWHSPGFGRREPAITLVGRGVCGPGDGDMVSVLEFHR